MSHSIEQEAANIIAPILNVAGQLTQFVLSVATASARVDMSTLLTQWSAGHYLTVQADGGTVYLAFNVADAGAIDETVTTAGAVTLCQAIPDGQTRHFRLPPIDDAGSGNPYQWLIHKGSVACKLRGYISSLAPSQNTADLSVSP